MSSSIVDASGPYSLLRIGEAWRNRSGLITLAVAFVSFACVSGLGAMTGNLILIMLFAVLAWLVLMAGLSAAGIQFMEQAAGKPVSGVLSALTASPLIVLRSFGLSIVLGLAFLAFLVLAAAILFVCKIPGLGAMLLVVAVPLITFAGTLIFLGMYVAFSLAAPALWEGHTLGAALAQLWAVTTQRPVEAFLNLLLLGVVVAILMGVLSGLLFAGLGLTAALSMPILGTSIGDHMPSMFGSMMGHGFSGGSSGLFIGGGLGASIVFAVAGALIAAMTMLGLSLVYLRITSGLDTAAAQAALDGALAKSREIAQHAAEEAKRRAHEAQVAAQHAAEEAKRRADEAQAAAQQRMGQARSAASTVAPTPAPWPGARECPACKSFVSPTDVFCGNCGHRLQ